MPATRSMLQVFCLATMLAALPAWSAGGVEASPPPMAQRLQDARKAIDAGRWSVALNELERARLDQPGNADIYNLLGFYHRKKPSPDLDKAFTNYKRALEINPSHKGAHEYIGEAYLMANKPDEARAHLAQLERICGNRTCEEYADLAEAIGKYKAP